MVSRTKSQMTSMMLRDLTLESLTPSVNTPLAFEILTSHFNFFLIPIVTSLDNNITGIFILKKFLTGSMLGNTLWGQDVLRVSILSWEGTLLSECPTPWTLQYTVHVTKGLCVCILTYLSTYLGYFLSVICGRIPLYFGSSFRIN